MNITILQPQWYDGIVATPLNREEITSLILTKMYTAALDLDDTVSFSGYVYSPTGKWSLAEYLMQLFNDLTIDIPTSGRYISFEDPEIENKLKDVIGDGIGVTSSDIQQTTSWNANWFYSNTSITRFNELSLFINVTKLTSGSFKGCTSLISINLSNITLIGPLVPGNDNYNNGVFLGCTSLTTVTGLSDIDYIGGWSFTNCTSLGTNQDLVINTTQNFIGSAAFYKTKYKSVVVNGPNVTNFTNGYYKPFESMPNCTYFDISNTIATEGDGNVIPNKTNLETIILPSTFSSLSYSMWSFSNNTIIKYFIILATTPPSYENTTYCRLGTNGNFYVPDNAVATYKSTWPEIAQSGWNIHDHIKPLSELPVGVWKTGLYQLYEPYLSHSSDPAYATT